MLCPRLSAKPLFFKVRNGYNTLDTNREGWPPVLTSAQNFIVYLMFLNGLLFLGLNFIAYSMVFPGKKRSKRMGYMLIVAVGLAVVVGQQLRLLVALEFEISMARQIILVGFAVPVFLLSLVYYRIQRARSETKQD